MKLVTKTLLVVVATLGAALRVDSAHADAVPPPPKTCPKGQVGVTSHGGPKCVLKAPKNCAPGYRGVLGGTCELATCSSDGECEGGRHCLQIETCQEYRELHWTGWGWGAQLLAPRESFFAGPPRPRPDGPPKMAWVNLSICGQDGACAAPAECRPAGLCYPPGSIGKTKAKLATSAASDSPPAPSSVEGGATAPETTASASNAEEPSEIASAANPADPAANPPRPSDPDGSGNDATGGCRKGCSVTSTHSTMKWVGLPVLALAVSFWRRRRRRLR